MIQHKNESGRAAVSHGSSAREIAYNIIRDKIIFFELKPGEPVSDKQLAEELNMSRTPVREALIILTTSNMVVLKPQAGTFVAPIDVEWMDIEQFSRKAIEKEVIIRACSKVNGDTTRLYRENSERFAQAVSLTDTPERIRTALELDHEFHRIAFTAAGLDKNYVHMRNNMQHIERLRVLSLILGDCDGLNTEHDRISASILEGDSVAALFWLDRHLNRYRNSLDIAKRVNPEYFELG